MQDNDVLSHYSEHSNFTDEDVQRALKEVSDITGFEPKGESQRRFLYQRDKTWRVRIAGLLDGQPASLRLENMQLETDEEAVREAFRAQSTERVRPPKSFTSAPYDAARGYAWSIDEDAGERVLFEPGGDPLIAVQAFVPFYTALRQAVRTPFWPAPMHFFRTSDTPTETRSTIFTQQQLARWRGLAEDRNPEALVRHRPLLDRLETAMLKGVTRQPLRFMHAHLAGSDVRLAADGAYVVFANHFWSWRQPGYDIAFAIWNQWMALPDERRTADGVREATEIWLAAIQASLADFADVRHVRTMLLNRCFGSLILDIPAKLERESPESVEALERAIIAEAEWLLA